MTSLIPSQHPSKTRLSKCSIHFLGQPHRIYKLQRSLLQDSTIQTDSEKCSQVLFIPLDCCSDAPLKGPFRIITKHFPRLTDICITVTDITGTVRTKDRFSVDIQRPAKAIVNIDQVFPSAICNVKRFTGGRTVCFSCLQIRFDYIINIGKVPALPTVAVNSTSLTA